MLVFRVNIAMKPDDFKRTKLKLISDAQNGVVLLPWYVDLVFQGSEDEWVEVLPQEAEPVNEYGELMEDGA